MLGRATIKLGTGPHSSYIFFAIDDVMVTSVNTYTSMMGMSTVDKYLIESLPENKKYGAK